MLHEWMTTWFHWVEQWGYVGVFVLMAMESSIFPVPSEIVMPPAAFWAAQGRFDFWGIVLAGTLGSYFGSAVTYWIAQWLGLPFVHRYGKYFLFSPEKVAFAEAWVKSHGTMGVFIARFLPVIRHLISIPAGIFRLSFVPFSIVTVVGAGAWCFILAWFGKEVIGDSPELLQSPEQLVHVMKAKLMWFVGGVVAFAALYGVMVWLKKRSKIVTA